MGIYLNPDADGFKKALNSQIYVDKSELILYTNKVFDSEQQYVCVSRPRRFGKSMAANMLAAYFGFTEEEVHALSIEYNMDFDETRRWYDVADEHVFIPNSEVAGEFVNAMKGAGWKEVVDAVKASDNRLKATWHR